MRDGTDYRRRFCFRVRWAREAVGLNQTEMAARLGIPVGQYKHFEGGRCTLMGHHLVQTFLDETHVDYAWLSTGNGRAPLRPPPVDEKGLAGPTTRPGMKNA